MAASGAATPAPRPVYLDGPPPGHTGGFGEPSCHRCHFDRPVDPPGGRMEVAGLPGRFEPGRPYRFEVRVSGQEVGRAGFQLSARCAAGPRRGEQAGSLEAVSGRVEVVEGAGEEYRGAAGVAYAGHTMTGTEPKGGDSVSWTVRWVAPEDPNGCSEVALHAAGNAANGDDSEFGDRIYLDTFRVARAHR